MRDRILIEGLELSSHIGVPDEERAAPQRLTVNLALEPIRNFGAIEERIENTVDYFAVGEFVKSLSAARPRKLIETLAEEIASELLEHFSLDAVEVELRKYILRDTQYVAVAARRERSRPMGFHS